MCVGDSEASANAEASATDSRNFEKRCVGAASGCANTGMPISVKHGAKTASLPLPPTLGALRSEVRELLDLPAGSLRLLCKGRAIEGDDDAPPGLEEGAKLMVMFSAAVAIDAAASAAPERMRGFEDSDRILRYGGLGGPAGAHSRAGGASSARPSSRFGFGRTEALPVAQLAAGATPGLQASVRLRVRVRVSPNPNPSLQSPNPNQG